MFELTEEQKRDIYVATLQAASQINNAMSTLYDTLMQNELDAAEGNEKKQDEIRKKYGEKKKAMAVAGIIMDTASAIIATWAGYAATAPGIPGAIMAGIQTGLIGTLAAIQLANVASTKFEKGGVLQGPSHAQGGILTPYGELEGGEGVINNSSMSSPDLRNLASIGNVAGGGNDFSVGDGSVKLSVESISMLAASINNKKVYVSESDITETQNKVSVVEQESVL